ncbi:general secretion pathway protein GspH [Thermus sp. LT1-2-5]|uniref:GspH/FimT family protein n=1 Tax=Thermus sp. LT1-2-5 TaxID=3026935 RepID=UPI0030EAAC71
MRRSGFTFLETLAALALLGLIGAIFSLEGRAWFLAQKERAALAELQAFLQRARTEAVTRGAMVAVVQEAGELTACLDRNGDGRCANEPVLTRYRPEVHSASVELVSGFQPGLRYNALGRPYTGARLVLRLGERRTTLCLTLGGRIRVVSGTRCYPSSEEG